MNNDHDHSLEERVNIACRWLLLIDIVSNVAPDEVPMDATDVSETITMLAREARAILEPLKRVPFHMAEWTPTGFGK